MSIRQMLPIGTVLRQCVVCGYPITARSDVLTAHETECLKIPEINMGWRIDDTGLILDGHVLVGSIVKKGDHQWHVEIMRFDGDHTFTGNEAECGAFIAAAEHAELQK
jgi:hypothetical protein